jgi:hypothetical protein
VIFNRKLIINKPNSRSTSEEAIGSKSKRRQQAEVLLDGARVRGRNKCSEKGNRKLYKRSDGANRRAETARMNWKSSVE